MSIRLSNPDEGLLLVSKIKNVGHHFFDVVFSVPHYNRALYEFNPGQYVIITMTVDGNVYKASYSISGSPHHPEQLVVTVEHNPSDVVARELYKLQDSKTQISVSRPKGGFVLSSALSNNATFYSTASGLSVLLPVIEYLLLNTESYINLYISLKDKSYRIFDVELKKMSKCSAGRFNFTYAYVGSRKATQSVKEMLLKGSDVYISGDQDFANQVKLLTGVPPRCHYSFDVNNTFKNNSTRVDYKNMVDVYLTTPSTRHKYSCSISETLLEGAERNGFHVASECAQSSCKKCSVKLTSGYVNRICEVSSLSDELLMCSVRPSIKSKRIYIMLNREIYLPISHSSPPPVAPTSNIDVLDKSEGFDFLQQLAALGILASYISLSYYLSNLIF